ncbi:BRCT domain-containing protein [Aspergillus falconensis]
MPTPNKKATTSNHLLFDPWNSASSGHQRSESSPGTAWQRTREAKLAQQFRSGDCTINSFVYNGVNRVYEKGEWEWDWGGDARGGRGGDGRGGKSAARGRTVVSQDSKQRDIRSMMGIGKGRSSSRSMLAVGEKMNMEATSTPTSTLPLSAQMPTPPYEPISNLTDLAPGAFSGTVLFTPNPAPSQHQPQSQCQSIAATSTIPELPILRGVTIYINGQTAPLVSDHKLKSLLVAHGARLALSLSRRVTHIIIGKPNAGPGRGGAGGGLAAGKIQKETARGGWRGMRIVGVEWVLESVKAGKRLPETRFAVNLGSQRSVLAFM